MINHIKNILKGFIESWAGFKEDEHIEMYTEDKSEWYCDEHPKYKHRCPKCNPKVVE